MGIIILMTCDIIIVYSMASLYTASALWHVQLLNRFILPLASPGQGVQKTVDR